MFGLTREIDAITWENEDGAVITPEMKQFEVDVGVYNDTTSSQTTSLTVKEGASAVDAFYKCVVTRDGERMETSVNLNVFCKFTKA